jgi:hypothetical protein
LAAALGWRQYDAALEDAPIDRWRGQMIGVVKRVLAIAAVAAMLPSTVALAQTDAAPAPDASAAAPAPAAPKPKPRPMVSVTITNQRKVGLKQLDAAAAGGPKSKTIVSKLAAGGKTVVKLGKGKDCLYDFHATYDDGQSADLTSVDICKDASINLVE